MSKTSNKITESYKNRKYSFEEKSDDNKIVLQIGEKSIEVFKKSNGYYSLYLPYSTYTSVSELAKKVIDAVPGFS